MESLKVPSATPILNCSNTVLVMYFDSMGEADVNSSDTKEIFLFTVPIPSKVAKVLKLSNTFFVVNSFENKVFCFLCLLKSSATNPKSPVFFHNPSTSFNDDPVEDAIAFCINCVENPIFFSSHKGNIKPCIKYVICSISFSETFFKKLAII